MSKNEAQQIVLRYKKKLEEEQYPISAVYLFGSAVKGTINPWSDIDVAVVSRRVAENYDEGRFALWRFRRDVDLRIEPHGFSPEDWENDADPMVYEIKKTGERIA